MISNRFDQVRALADGGLFEFGLSRRHDLALRTRIVHWQLPTQIGGKENDQTKRKKKLAFLIVV
jgi:hypothetical protein